MRLVTWRELNNFALDQWKTFVTLQKLTAVCWDGFFCSLSLQDKKHNHFGIYIQIETLYTQTYRLNRIATLAG